MPFTPKEKQRIQNELRPFVAELDESLRRLGETLQSFAAAVADAVAAARADADDDDDFGLGHTITRWIAGIGVEEVGSTTDTTLVAVEPIQPLMANLTNFDELNAASGRSTAVLSPKLRRDLAGIIGAVVNQALGVTSVGTTVVVEESEAEKLALEKERLEEEQRLEEQRRLEEEQRREEQREKLAREKEQREKLAREKEQREKLAREKEQREKLAREKKQREKGE